MRAVFFAAFLAFVPLAVSALSCRPHSVEAAFLQAQEDAGRFVVVHGRLDFTGVSGSQTQRIKGELRGSSLSGAGFATPYHNQVILELKCFGQWCASAKSGADVLAFVRIGQDGDVISATPCGGYLFTSPTRQMIDTAKNCFDGQACVPLR